MSEPVGVVAVAGTMVVMSVIVLGATFTGNGKELCDRMGGVYTPQPTGEVCPGGKWLNLFRSIPKPEPQKK